MVSIIPCICINGEIYYMFIYMKYMYVKRAVINTQFSVFLRKINKRWLPLLKYIFRKITKTSAYFNHTTVLDFILSKAFLVLKPCALKKIMYMYMYY